MLVKDLIDCQKRYVLIMNKLLYNDNTVMVNEMEALRLKSNTTYNNELFEAPKYLALLEYE